jgi:Tfp pilus assembly pilus retraction ATPase PilT
MFLLDEHLAELVKKKLVTKEEAALKAQDPEEFARYLAGAELEFAEV